jgi:hypothetical protein
LGFINRECFHTGNFLSLLLVELLVV